ncbi:hypothetical protein HDK90DRAFT_276216 [Phyllosticta capitalensis]|uniref:Uncharacterized protein n=1 Tax=Phyllosticta capitalensis TaxID=121624 RepID=A0ABR1YMN0_9PEZI
MFERAAITNGELPKAPKRKAPKTVAESPKRKSSKSDLDSTAAAQRRISSSMRSTKPSSTLSPMNSDAGQDVPDKAKSEFAKKSRREHHARQSSTGLDELPVFTPVTSMDIFANKEPATSVALNHGASSPGPKASHAGSKPLRSQMTSTIVNSSSSQTFFPAVEDLERMQQKPQNTDSGDELSEVSSVASIEFDDAKPRRVDVPVTGVSRISPGTLVDDVADHKRTDDELAEFEAGVTDQDLLDLVEADGFEFSSVQSANEARQDSPNSETYDFDDGLTRDDFNHVLEDGHETPANDERQPENVDHSPTEISKSDFQSGVAQHRRRQDSPSTHNLSEFDFEIEDNWQIFEDLDDEDQNGNFHTQHNEGSKSIDISPTKPISQTPLPSCNGTFAKPIVRPSFPPLVKDRSPIVGLNSSTSLRVCFRIGEALNAGVKAAREQHAVVIELYARVLSSYREPRPSTRQHFVLMDLFHDRPPYLNATFDTWKGTNLYDSDSTVFTAPSSKPRLCRCTGKLRRENVTWRLEILNIWKANMEDAEYVAGIVQS